MIMMDMMMESDDDDDYLNDLNLTAIFSSLLAGLCLVRASLVTVVKINFISNIDPTFLHQHHHQY